MNKDDMILGYMMIMDDDGYTWYWDGSYIFALDVDDPDTCIDVDFIHRKRYQADTWEKAVGWLVTDGFISKEQGNKNVSRSYGQEYKDWFDPKEGYLPDY